MKKLLVTLCGMGLVGCSILQKDEISEASVTEHYADLALAMYQDSLTTAQALQTTVDVFIASPTEDSLTLAKAAWKASRAPYQQTEAYRFGNAIVDDWEGKVNAWPLDEGLIDYVDTSYGTESDANALYNANIIANTSLTFGGKTIDVPQITPKFLGETLHEIDGVESNVATGYHAVEFLLWGQDLNGTGPGAGARPASDYDTANCKVGNCERRAQYLKAATDLLVSDLEWIVAQWEEGGNARAEVMKDPKAGISTILTGMGSLSYGELAGERMKLGVMLHDPEEEHDCFSDNTHYSHYYDALSIKNVYTGSYTRVDGSKVSGPSVADLVAAAAPSVNDALLSGLDKTLVKMQVLVDSAEKDGIAYDQLIAEGNEAGNAKVMAAVNALVDQTKEIEKAVEILALSGIDFEGSDSLDNPSAVY